MTIEFVNLVNLENYEILNTFPFTIRNKSTGKIVEEHLDKSGYYELALFDNGIQHKYLKHRLIAEQFIANPDNLPVVDHINHNRTDNRIDNLRWVTQADNLRNRKSQGNIIYEFVNDIPEDSFVVDEYGTHKFEDYYYSEDSDKFYYYNGRQYRVLHVNTHKRGYKYVCLLDVDNEKINVILSKFKKLYNIQ